MAALGHSHGGPVGAATCSTLTPRFRLLAMRCCTGTGSHHNRGHGSRGFVPVAPAPKSALALGHFVNACFYTILHSPDFTATSPPLYHLWTPPFGHAGGMPLNTAMLSQLCVCKLHYYFANLSQWLSLSCRFAAASALVEMQDMCVDPTQLADVERIPECIATSL